MASLNKQKGKKRKKGTKAARAGMLFTHKGFSGPAVLDLSHHAVMASQRGTDRPGTHALSDCCITLNLLALQRHMQPTSASVHWPLAFLDLSFHAVMAS